MRKFLILILFMFGCQTTKDVPKSKPKVQTFKQVDSRIPQLRDLFYEKMAEAALLRNSENGWIVWDDCDSMLWTGKYAAVACDVNIQAAEWPTGRRGRYGRKPGFGCSTSWSRDMGVGGFFPYTFRCNRRDLLESHAKYGAKNRYKMGEPMGDGRVLYTFNVIGLMYRTIKKMGGKRNWLMYLGTHYPSGQTGYHAHIQMMQLWLRWHAQGKFYQKWKDRIREHKNREPNNPFYQLMDGYLSGNQSKTITLLLDPAMPMSDYVRCGEGNLYRCKLAEWLWVTNEVLRLYGYGVKPIS